MPTAPSSVSSSVAHANPLEYHPVTKKQAKLLEKIAVRAPGVQNVAYSSDTKTIDMFMTKAATTKQRVIADRVVNQVLHPATTPTPSKSKAKKKHHKHH